MKLVEYFKIEIYKIWKLFIVLVKLCLIEIYVKKKQTNKAKPVNKWSVFYDCRLVVEEISYGISVDLQASKTVNKLLP